MHHEPDHKQPIATELDAVFQAPDQQHWVDTATRALADGRTLEDIRKQTLDGIAIDVLYHSCNPAYTREQPGSGTTAALSWDNRLCLNAEPDTASSNRRVLDGLRGGITSIEVHTRAPGQLGGLLNGVDLSLAKVSLRAGLQYAQAAEELMQFAQSQSITIDDCSFSFNADPVGHALAQSNVKTPINDSLHQMVQFCKGGIERFPGSHCVLVDVAAHHNAGASPVQELHAAIATATLYLEHLLQAGIDAGQALQQIGFQVALDCDVLAGVTKLRALDHLWRHVAKELGGNETPDITANVVTETSKRFISHLDPWNNHLRNLFACMSAAQASASTIIVHPHAGSDTDLADRLARNLPIIVEREAGLLHVADPLAGSYAVESLTAELVNRTWQSLQETDTSAAWLSELRQGRWQARLKDTQARRTALLDSEQQIMVGVNRYPPTDEVPANDLRARLHVPDNSESQPADNPAMPPLHHVRDSQQHELSAIGVEQ